MAEIIEGTTDIHPVALIGRPLDAMTNPAAPSRMRTVVTVSATRANPFGNREGTGILCWSPIQESNPSSSNSGSG